jgi:hypothetical protein
LRLRKFFEQVGSLLAVTIDSCAKSFSAARQKDLHLAPFFLREKSQLTRHQENCLLAQQLP